MTKNRSKAGAKRDASSSHKQDRIKVTLGDTQSRAALMAEQYAMSEAQFCAYCVKYVVGAFFGRDLPRLPEIKDHARSRQL